MQFMFPVDNDCPESIRKAFFEALRDSSVRRLADEAAYAAAQLSTKFGRLAELRLAVLTAESIGASAADCLRDRIAELRSQDTAMRQHSGDLDRYMKAQRERFSPGLNRCSAVLTSAPAKIEALRVSIRNFDQARAKMIERLREAGLDDSAIERAGVSPNEDDLANWHRQIEATERDVQSAKAFVGSGPLYDTALLDGMSNG